MRYNLRGGFLSRAQSFFFYVNESIFVFWGIIQVHHSQPDHGNMWLLVTSLCSLWIKHNEHVASLDLVYFPCSLQNAIFRLKSDKEKKVLERFDRKQKDYSVVEATMEIVIQFFIPFFHCKSMKSMYPVYLNNWKYETKCSNYVNWEF